MPFVMVPVPEEHVYEVMQHLLRLHARDSVEPWDEAAVEEFFADSDEVTKTLLSVVARGALAGKEVSTAEAVTAMQLQLRDLNGVLRPLQDRCRELNRAPIVEVRVDTEIRANGRPWTTRSLLMPEDVAGLVRDAERAELEDERHPLEGASG